MLTAVKLEDLSHLWGNQETVSGHRLFLPLMYEEGMIGLLVTTREKRPWQSWELTQMEKITQTLALACVLDRQLGEERYYRQWQRQRLDTFLHQIRNPLTALKTFGKLLLKRLLAEEGNDPAITGMLRESDRVRDLIAEFEAQIQQESENYPTVDSRGKEVKREKKPAQYFTENLGNDVTLEMVAIPAGQFKMGSPDGQGNDNDDEEEDNESKSQILNNQIVHLKNDSDSTLRIPLLLMR